MSLKQETPTTVDGILIRYEEPCQIDLHAGLRQARASVPDSIPRQQGPCKFQGDVVATARDTKVPAGLRPRVNLGLEAQIYSQRPSGRMNQRGDLDNQLDTTAEGGSVTMVALVAQQAVQIQAT
ncbi:hypothetical protein PoB_000265300 [Plakobranchus ocellatus]|uniref:Uncharacterized protein n=1 Tax=Plakobranchus ocellatus TaxID=259542 RepID=A0AAV3Y1M1_9GAST|nr:hypothetical protein PoB_000265300 [Plakobranchus ocellatus]